jgi:hypothetical protein
MKISTTQKEIMHGMILGDAYLQKTGEKNARLRIEHSAKQKDYVDWKYNQLENIFQSKPKKLVRDHPKNQRQNTYYRLQSNASPVFGKLRSLYYDKNSTKIIPSSIDQILSRPLTIAVWYMDDGYYDRRDKSAHIYLPKYSEDQLDQLVKAFKQWGINPRTYCRPDRKACQINFTGKNKEKLMSIIQPYLIQAMRYKSPLDPVTTEGEK